jgi:diacylglycerol kinase family enzyme
MTVRQSAIRIETSQGQMEGELVLVGNGRLYGGNYQVFPEARLEDGQLEICVFPKVSWRVLARCGPELLWSGRLPGTVVKRFTTPEVRLTSTGETPVELDGEWVGHLPARFSLRRQALRVIVPALYQPTERRQKRP